MYQNNCNCEANEKILFEKNYRGTLSVESAWRDYKKKEEQKQHSDNEGYQVPYLERYPGSWIED